MNVPGEQLLIKLWESIADKGIGSLLKPWQKRREGKVAIEMKRQELLVLAQTEADANLIRLGQKRLLPDGTITEIENVINDKQRISLQHIATVANQNMLTDAIRKEINLSKTIIYTESELLNDSQERSDIKVSDDWLFRWKEFASKVSDEQIQQLWAKMLAGEIKNPGTSSYRLLDFIDKLNKNEIESISKVFSLTMVNNNLIVRGTNKDTDYLVNNNLKKMYFAEMAELGVVSQSTVGAVEVATPLDLSKFDPFHLEYNGFIVTLRKTDITKDGKLSVMYYTLTTLGRELFTMAKVPTSREYLESLLADFSESGVTSEMKDCNCYAQRERCT